MIRRQKSETFPFNKPTSNDYNLNKDIYDDFFGRFYKLPKSNKHMTLNTNPKKTIHFDFNHRLKSYMWRVGKKNRRI